MSASTAMVGWPGVPSATTRMRWLPALSQALRYSTRVGRKAVENELTVAVSLPSM